MTITRREFGRVALAGIPTLGAALRGSTRVVSAQAAANPSTWGGVRVGLNVPYSLGLGNNIAAEELLTQLVDLEIGSVELRAQPVEHFLGSPTVRAAGEAAKAREAARAAGQTAPTPQQMAQGGLGGGRTQTPEQAAAAEAQKTEVRTWRLSRASSARVKELRQMYEKAGVLVDVLKVDDLYTVSDEELDYFFQMARDLGARAISSELPQQRTDTKRIGAFADKHKDLRGLSPPRAGHRRVVRGDLRRGEVQRREHRHRPLDGHARRVAAALHHQARRPHPAHPREGPPVGTNGGQNRPFGEGDTPIRQMLQAIRDNKWDVRPIIEFEYRVPEGSTRAAEIRKAFAYCQAALQA